MRSLALWRGAGLAVLLAVVALVPLAGNIQLTQVGVLVLMYVGAAVAWNIFSGFTGYISLGAAVFFGVGVYTVALITQHNSLVGGVVFALFPLGGLVAAVVAVPFGLVALRVRRHTFVVVTIAVFFIFQLMASNFSWTGGVAGIIPPFLNWDQATVYNPFYYTAMLIAVVSAVLVITLASMVDVYWNPEWSTVVLYGAVVLVLVFRPQGIFGRKEARAQ